jgi:signal transduction histidine kinase
MFEPFVTTRIKGTGLGMAIAAEVVRAHGGEITAQNHPDGGAFLQLWIPKTTGREQATTES